MAVPEDPLSRTKVPPASLLAIAWIASLLLIFAPSAARAKVNIAGLLTPYSFLAHRAPQLQFCHDTGSNAKDASTASMGLGTWRLVRTPGPRGGPGQVSIAQTADASRSNIDLVGLMLRCSDTGFDVLVIFLRPFPPRAHPKVKVTTGGEAVLLDATVISPGAAILLPTEAAALANGSWQSSLELAIEVDDGGTVMRGVIPLAGLGPALSLLTSNCTLR
jgi:hypothetical protein